jgi:hypothetical protein
MTQDDMHLLRLIESNAGCRQRECSSLHDLVSHSSDKHEVVSDVLQNVKPCGLQVKL